MAKTKTTQTSNSKLLLLILLIVVIIIVVLTQIPVNFKDLWPSKAKINSKLKQLEKEQLELQTLLNKVAALEQNHQSFLRYASNFWLNTGDDKYKVAIKRIIYDAASKSGVTLDTAGQIQQKNLMEGIDIMEVSIGGKGKTEEVGNFLKELYFSKPRFYWIRSTFRPNNRTKPEFVFFSGNLRFVMVTDQKLIDMINNK